MEAAAKALSDSSRNHLLHIDEINRSDLGKILGEAIFLLEATANSGRRIDLPYDFGEPFHRTFFLPQNLHILGTMNSADRSIADRLRTRAADELGHVAGEERLFVNKHKLGWASTCPGYLRAKED